MKTKAIAENGKETRVMEIFKVGIESELNSDQEERVRFFSNLRDAEEYFSQIEEEVGFFPFIDTIKVNLDDFKGYLEEERGKNTFEVSDILSEIEEYFPKAYPTPEVCRVKIGSIFLGRKLNPNGIIVTYSHETYLNYSFKIWSVDFVKNTPIYFERDLISDVRVFRPTFAYFENIDELIEEYEKKIGIFGKLCGGGWMIEEFIKNQN